LGVVFSGIGLKFDDEGINAQTGKPGADAFLPFVDGGVVPVAEHGGDAAFCEEGWDGGEEGLDE